MRFADPQACPDCRGALNGDSICPHCGLDLGSPEVRQLWQLLLNADVLLAAAARIPRPPAAGTTPPVTPTGQAAAAPPTTAPAPAPAPFMPPAAAFAPGFAPYPAPAAPAPRPERRWSVGTILVTLGAFGLIVAGFIFVTGSWGDLGLTARTLILGGATLVIAGLGAWVTMRPLRVSAEAVWMIVLALLTLDFFAARHENMLGLGNLGVAGALLVWGVGLVGLGVAIVLWARRFLDADLVAPSLVGGTGLAMAAIGAGGIGHDWDLSWRTLVALLASGVLALATRPAKIRFLTITARIVVAGFYLMAFVVAAIELVENPSMTELVSGRHGLPMLLMALASVVVAGVVHQVRIPAVAFAVLAVTLLVVTPAAEDNHPEGWWLAVAALAAVLVMGAARGTDDWVKGVRAGAVPVVAAFLLVQVGLVGDLLNAVGFALDHIWDGAWDDRLTADVAADVQVWVVAIMLLALLVVAWFLPRWPELSSLRPHATAIFAIAASMGVAVGVVAAQLPLWAGVATLLVVAAALVAVGPASERFAGDGATADRSDADHPPRSLVLVGAVAAVVVLVASALAASSHGVAAPTWLVGAALMGGLTLTAGPPELRMTYSAGAGALGVAGIGATVALFDPPDQVVALVVLVAGLALMATAGLLLREHVTRLPLEIVGALAAFGALFGDASSSELAFRWTIAGVAVIALGPAVTDRRWYVWPGIGAMVVAYVLLIISSGFSFVEAYTLPLGAAALALGLYRVLRDQETSTWLYLGPGLALCLLPSVPQALADPTDLRALLLGAASLVALVAGVRLGWQAPFLSGVTLLTLLVLFNIGPYANAAPRVVIIALVGAISLGIGITWEDRVRDGRKIVGYVRSMR
ncbi:MAG: hypothetical protein H7270_12245 [Dermatophilaceae bacterium]|nr:hypothetical protein [Dermatophilaceae bacterium]